MSERRRVDGVLLLDKPTGITSNAALMRVKRLYAADKAGHTGTLDPLASGLLPICFGGATRFAQFLLDAPKRYVATLRFGVTTSTQDAEGDVVTTRSVELAREALEATLARFVGVQMQTPPAHSALKYEGRPRYDYARRGVDVPSVPREIVVHALRLLDWHAPDATVDVACGKGTYVRALAADIGEALGCGAHLAALRRTQSGPFDIGGAVTLDALERDDEAARIGRLLPVDAPVTGIPRLDVDHDVARLLAHGQKPRIAAAPGRYRIYAPGERFVGLAEVDAHHLIPLRLIAQDADRRETAGTSGVATADRVA